VIVDKMGKTSEEAMSAQLAEQGLDTDAISTIRSTLGLQDLDALSSALGDGSPAVSELTSLFSLIDSYGISDWVAFDASVVRGLAYYTGPVFEAHDRAGELRAIVGGGRYDRLLSTLGGRDMPATGFGFGDMVIMELLASKGLVPELSSGNQDLVVSSDESLRPAAMSVAQRLRASGRTVDLVLEDKRMKWVFRHAERSGAQRLVMVMPEEWGAGNVRIKDLESGEEIDISFDDL
jgi:histidyl-tRNA synthetase